MNNLTKLIKVCLLTLFLVLPFAVKAATPVPQSDWSGSAAQLTWNISLNNGIYTYLYTYPQFDGTTGEIGNFVNAFYLQADPSITNANLSTQILNESGTVPFQQLGSSVSVGNNTVPSPGNGTFYSINWNAPNDFNTGMDLSFQSPIAPVFGQAELLFNNVDLTDGIGSPGAVITQETGFPTLGPAVIVATPEPMTWLLLGSTLALIALKAPRLRKIEVK